MKKNEEYSGWTNYETWAVNLWFGDYGKELAERFKGKKNAIYNFADELEYLIRDDTPGLESPYAELLATAISEVNFRELAKAYLSD